VVRIVERAVFEASPERVWSVLADWDRQASWMPDVAWIRLLSPDRELGARALVRTKVLGIPAANDVMRVTAWDPPRRMFIHHEGVVVGTGEWLLEPSPGGARTRFTWTEVIRMRLPLIGAAALWLYRPVQRRMLRRSIRNLRGLVESAT
jgi:carbon monoxide dehydrogenase subunit G